MNTNSSRPSAWQGGDAAFAERKRIIEETKDDLESGDHAKRVAALCALASAHYSCVKHANAGDKIGLLAQAKTCLDGAMDAALQYRLQEGDFGDGASFPLTADQCDVLSTIALRSIKVLGMPFVASNPRLALRLALAGLERCTAETAPHTVALLCITQAEIPKHTGAASEAHVAMDRAHEVLRIGIPDERQRVRVLKRLGALYVTELGNRKVGGELLKEAWDLASRVAPGQLASIDQLVRQLRRSWWHPMKWFITVT